MIKTLTPKNILVLACISFLVSGLFNGSVGPVLSELAAKVDSSLAAIGGIFTCLFLGALVTQIAGGPIADSLGLKKVLVTAFLLLAVGVFGFTQSPSLPILFVCFFIIGLGQGLMGIGVNLMVSNAFAEKSTSYLNLIHFFFGLGSITGPILISLVIRFFGSGISVHWGAAALYAVLAILYAALYQNIKPIKTAHSSENFAPKINLYRSPLLWMIGFMLLVYVGTECGIGNWSTTLMAVATGMATQTGALVTSAFWAMLTLGRLFGTLLSRKLSITQLLALTIFGELSCGIVFTLLLGSTAGMIAALVAMGFFMGPTFPTILALTTRSFPQDQGKAIGLTSALSSIGGLSLPFLDGVFLDHNDPRGFALFNVAIMVILVVFYLITRSFSKKHYVSID